MKVKFLVAGVSLVVVQSGFALAQVLPAPLAATASSSVSSWLAGGHLGYNWQNGSLIYGLEGDISALDLNSRMNTTIPRVPAFLPTATAVTTSSLDWYGTVRGRLGWANGPWMVYGTGGLAYGRINLDSTLTDNFGPTQLRNQLSSTKTGWVAGVGAEYLLRPNVILSVGYQYVDLGSVTLAGGLPDGSLQQTIRGRGQFQVVSVGASWLFSADSRTQLLNEPKYVKAPYAKAPVVSSSPWAGVYAGGHVGGAWGNQTDANYTDSVAIFASDARLKQDIQLIGYRPDGLGIYSYRYLWSPTVYVGVMAQEVALIYPDAIVRGELDSFLRVDYSRIGMTLLTLTE